MKHPKKLSFLILLAVATFTCVCVWNLQYLEVDYNFEKFYPQNDPETTFFEEHRKKFSSDNDFLLVAIKNN